MSVKEICKCWKSHIIDPCAAVEWWDGKASAFASKELPTPENSLAMRLVLENGMLKKGQKALDVGCGAGRFSFALEQLGACVTGLDFSPRMIETCEKAKMACASSASFMVCDWHDVNLKELGWNKRFDLVLANMTPAVDSADTFLKLSEASRKWCLMVKPARRKNSVLDQVTALLELPRDTNALEETLLYAFELLRLSGLKPRVEYEEQVWESTRKTEDAIREYTLRLSSSHTLSPRQKEAIAAFLRSISVDDCVKETTHTTMAAVYWQV